MITIIIPSLHSNLINIIIIIIIIIITIIIIIIITIIIIIIITTTIYYYYYYYYFLEIPVTFELKGMNPSQGAVEKFFHRLEVVAFEVLPRTS